MSTMARTFHSCLSLLHSPASPLSPPSPSSSLFLSRPRGRAIHDAHARTHARTHKSMAVMQLSTRRGCLACGWRPLLLQPLLQWRRRLARGDGGGRGVWLWRRKGRRGRGGGIHLEGGRWRPGAVASVAAVTAPVAAVTSTAIVVTVAGSGARCCRLGGCWRR